MFQWLKSKRAVEFGIELAKIYMEHVPNDPGLQGGKRSSKTNYAKEKMLKRLRAFKDHEVLNFYKTSRLLNAFKWSLKDAGYEDREIELVTSWTFNVLRS